MKKLFLFLLFIFLSIQAYAIEHQGYGYYDSSIDTRHFVSTNSFKSNVPLRYSGLKLWLDSSDISTIVQETGVRTWKDKSGNGNHFHQTDTSKQPEYIINGQNGLNTIDFNGSGDFLQGPNSLFNYAPGTDEISIFVVYEADALTGYFLSKAGANSANRTGIFINANVHNVIIGGSSESPGDVLSTDTIYLVNANIGSSSARIYENNVDKGALSVGSNTNVLDWRIGARSNADVEDNSAAFLFNGEICEIIVYDKKMNNLEREVISNYLIDNWMK